MKKLYFIIIAFVLGFSQSCHVTEETIKSSKLVAAPTFKGCEKYVGNKEESIKCIGNVVGKLILKNLDTTFPRSVFKERIITKVGIRVDENKKVTGVKVIKGENNSFTQNALAAAKKAAAEIEKQKLIIKPAKILQGACATTLIQDVVLKNPRYSPISEFVVNCIEKGYSNEKTYKKTCEKFKRKISKEKFNKFVKFLRKNKF